MVVQCFQIHEDAEKEAVATYLGWASKWFYLCLHYITETTVGNGLVKSGRFIHIEIIWHVGRWYRGLVLLSR